MSEPVRELHLTVALERAIQIAERLNEDEFRRCHINTAKDYHTLADTLADLKIMARNARKFGVISEVDYLAEQERKTQEEVESLEQLAEELE